MSTALALVTLVSAHGALAADASPPPPSKEAAPIVARTSLLDDTPKEDRPFTVTAVKPTAVPQAEGRRGVAFQILDKQTAQRRVETGSMSDFDAHMVLRFGRGAVLERTQADVQRDAGRAAKAEKRFVARGYTQGFQSWGLHPRGRSEVFSAQRPQGGIAAARVSIATGRVTGFIEMHPTTPRH